MIRICFLFFITVSFFLVSSCGSSDRGSALNFKPRGRIVPDFNADSTLLYLKEQLSFGPRNPGSTGHEKTGQYLREELIKRTGRNRVFTQGFTHVGYEGDTLKLTNIIAAFNILSADRIMLCAHWDTRPRADKDTADIEKPIPGADDGASGVAVLLELARLLEKNPPPIGVDIVFFDGEDYGKEGDTEQYFLGSRHWATNPPVQGYNPRFGILLDMVGGENAVFPKEINSYRIAPALVDEIWEIGQELGYDKIFVNETGASISDDHLIISRITGIPTIDIIRHRTSPDGSAIFAPYWHTHEDDLDIIDKYTLEAIGNTITELVYNRIL